MSRGTSETMNILIYANPLYAYFSKQLSKCPQSRKKISQKSSETARVEDNAGSLSVFAAVESVLIFLPLQVAISLSHHKQYAI